MNKNQTAYNNNTVKNNSKPVTSPIAQGKLVSTVNALTMNTSAAQIQNPQNMVFSNEKGKTLNYKYIVDELIKLATVDTAAGFYSRMYEIINQAIDSSFYAIGLYKDKWQSVPCQYPLFGQHNP